MRSFKIIFFFILCLIILSCVHEIIFLNIQIFEAKFLKRNTYLELLLKYLKPMLKETGLKINFSILLLH